MTVGEQIHYSRLTGSDPGTYVDLSDGEIRRRMAEFDGPHGYDPAPALEAMNVPSLWILGGQDRSVPTELTVRALQALKDRRPGQLEFHVFPQGNHAIRDANTGRSIDYWVPIHKWLQERHIVRPAGG